MFRFTFTQRHADAVTQNLRAAANVSQRRLNMTTYDWSQMHVVRHLVVKPYPPMRPNQRYRRTWRLQARWKSEATDGGARIYNEQPYAGYVVGDEAGRNQAWMHAGRWWLARDVVAEAQPKLRDMLVREMDRIL